MRPVELARVGFGVLDELRQRCPRRGAVNGDDLESFGDPSNRCKILDRIVARRGRYRRDDGQRAGISQEQRIAVRGRFRDFARADCAARRAGKSAGPPGAAVTMSLIVFCG